MEKQTAVITEEQWQSQVLQLARLLKYRCYHTHDSRRSEPGFPDLVMVRGKRVIFAELKRETGRLTPSQHAWLRSLSEAGQEAYVWRPSDFDKVMETLKRTE